MADKKPTVLDLFSGCGGLSKGFEMVGFTILAANDIWDTALQTFEINHPKTEIIKGDITDPDIRKKIIEVVDKKVDVIIGGPPCQAYSLAGRRDPNDPRGKLFYQYVDIVKEINPKFFVIENVKGILAMNHFKENLTETDEKKMIKLVSEMNMLAEEKKNLKIDITAEAAAKRKREIESEIAKIRKKLRDFQEPVTQLIESEFRKIGYSVKYNLLNAADYGVPQKRQRVIFIGSKNERDIKFPQPTHMKNPPSNYTLDGKKLKKWVPVSSILFDKESGDVERYFHSQRMIDGFRRREKIHKKFGNGFGWQILRPDEPSFTISARYWKDGSDALVKYSDDEIRMLTERECARIQSFPDTFEFAGSKRDVYTQIGNAVPPLLAKAVAKEIMKSLAK